MHEKILILDSIRSAHNVGSLFRTADGAGVSRIILGGYTPTPVDRFGRVQPKIEKTSLGAVSTVAWSHVPEYEQLLNVIEALKKEGFSIVAVEQSPKSVPLYDFVVPEKVAYILGNEVEGVSQELLSCADTIVEIPMKGSKESLNVSITGGIVLFHG